MHGLLEETSDLEGLEPSFLTQGVRINVGIRKEHGGGDLGDINERVDVHNFDVMEDAANAHVSRTTVVPVRG